MAKADLKLILLVAVLVIAGLGFYYVHLHGLPGATNRPPIVTIDAVKLVNAERAAVAKLSGVHDGGALSGDTALKTLQIGKSVIPAIRSVAGPDTVVLVKQAVVGSTLPDITDQVLRRLGLPTDAPTVSLGGVIQQAPTTSSFTQGESLEKANAALRAAALQAHNAAASAQQDKALP